MLGRIYEVFVCCQQRKIVLNTQLSDECVNSAKLCASTPTLIAKIRCGNMRVTIWLKQGQRLEPLDDAFAIFRSREALKKLLDHDASRYHGLTSE